MSEMISGRQNIRESLGFIGFIGGDEFRQDCVLMDKWILQEIGQQFPVIETVKKLEKALEDVTNPLTVSIIGCVVNGPGEAAMTEIGITGGGNNTHMIYIDGKKNHRIKDVDLIPYLEKIIREKSSSCKKNNH